MSVMDNVKMEFFELGDKTALVCSDPNMTESLRATLRDLGYKSHAVETSDAAIERIRYTQYDCILIDENFAASSLRSNAVLHHLAPLPMAQRRHSFVCLIGSSFKTMDAMQAFAHSVHLVVNPADMPALSAILKKSLFEFELLYRVYKDVAVTAGAK
jgi:CheY-like chemotaxis protein